MQVPVAIKKGSIEIADDIAGVVESIVAKRGHGRVEIDRERCKGCALCVRACSLLTIDSVQNSSGVYPAKTAGLCSGCGRCYTVCPDVCISVYEIIE
jgi:2-oxoglutarate ferredoxin oxidoreductase subunit delta